MTNSIQLVDESSYVKITEEAGITYAYKVVKNPYDPQGYICKGYATAGAGITIAEWQYEALDITEAYEQKTKNYLVRELRPLAVQSLKWMGLTYERWLSFVSESNARAIKEAIEAN